MQGKVGEEPEVKGPISFRDHGRPGGKTFVTAEKLCGQERQRLIRKHLELGYLPLRKVGLKAGRALDLFSPLPPYLKTCKPKDSISVEAFHAMLEAGTARAFRKYDGNRTIPARDRKQWHINSSGGHSLTERCGPQIEALAKEGFKAGTVFLSELVMFRKDDPYHEDFHALNSWADPKRDPVRVRNEISRGLLPEPTLVICDIFALNGKPLTGASFDERWKIWKHLPVAGREPAVLAGAEFLTNVTPANWRQRVRKLKIEGMVLYDANEQLGRKAFSYTKEEPRADGIYKLKGKPTEDVVIIAAREEEGKLMSVYMKQLYPSIHPKTGRPHPKAGQWFYCGGMRIGNRAEIREHLRRYIPERIALIKSRQEKKGLPDLIHKRKLGVPVEIAYSDRDASGQHCFRHAVFLDGLRSFRDEKGNQKAKDQCVIQNFGSGILKSKRTGSKK